VDPLFAQHRANRHKAAGKGFGQHHDVRVHRAVVFDGEKFSRAPHAGLHLVVNEQRAMLAAELLRREQVAGAGRFTPLPWTGSTMNPATSPFFNSFSSASRSLKGIMRQSGRNGAKPSRKLLSPLSASAPLVRP
jgi:hypothetical protein